MKYLVLTALSLSIVSLAMQTSIDYGKQVKNKPEFQGMLTTGEDGEKQVHKVDSSGMLKIINFASDADVTINPGECSYSRPGEPIAYSVNAGSFQSNSMLVTPSFIYQCVNNGNNGFKWVRYTATDTW